MQVIDKLLESVDRQMLKDYESQVQLHLKNIMTTINKNKLEDTIPAKVSISQADKKI
jgi:hypothetical protein